MKIKNEYALIAGLIVEFFHSYIASLLDLGIRFNGIHLHHFYIALIIFPFLLTFHLIKGFNLFFRNIPSWVFYFLWGLILGMLISEIIFVGEYGFWGYLYFN